MTILEYLREYLKEYPKLTGERIDIDCLGSKPDSLSLDAVPSEPIVQRYLNGATVRRCLFLFSCRAYYGQDLKQQAENLAFLEGLEEWLERQRLFCKVPKLGEKRTARPITVITSAYPAIINGDTGMARYQIQCELLYTQEV